MHVGFVQGIWKGISTYHIKGINRPREVKNGIRIFESFSSLSVLPLPYDYICNNIDSARVRPDRLFLIPEHKYALMSSSSRYPTFLAPFPSVTIYTQIRLCGIRVCFYREKQEPRGL